jgi:hypothetical protein
MRLTRKSFIIGVAGSALVLILAVVLPWIAHVLANRDTVQTFIAAKTAQATGAELAYGHLGVALFPIPHVSVRDVRLRHPDRFDLRADALAVYPGILSALQGKFDIRRLDLLAPAIRIAVGADTFRASEQTPKTDQRTIQDTVMKPLSGIVGALAAIRPGAMLRVEAGTVTLLSGEASDLHITGIDARMDNDGGTIAIAVDCASEATGRLNLQCHVDAERLRAEGRLTIAGIHLDPLVRYAGIPGGVSIDDTRAMIDAAFSIDGAESVTSRVDLRLPALTVRRKGRQVKLEEVSLTGSVGIVGQRLTLSVDHLQSTQPPLSLSASAELAPADAFDRSVLDVHAAAKQLDIEVAGRITRAIAGDLEAIRTAFAVAREGQLTDATYHARFEPAGDGYQLAGMSATGHLRQGRITLPGIGADVEQVDAAIAYQDRQVAFNGASGHFNGATFDKLDAAIDWESAATLSIDSTAVSIDAHPFFNWLLAFDDLSAIRNYIDAMDGAATLTRLNIKGPLTKPAQWDFSVHGSPEKIRLSSPLLPFDPRFSGGRIVYHPGSEQATDVSVEFLDASLVASYQTQGLVDPAAIDCRLDGSVGSQAVAWLIGRLPLPDHLQLKPPVKLTGIHVGWSDKGERSFRGSMKTAGNVALLADISRLPEAWDLRRIEFSDGLSTAVASGRIAAGRIEVSFAGNVEKATADRILADNRTLAGRVEGNFQAAIDMHRPLESTFTGRLSGEDLQIHRLLPEPVTLARFAIEGDGDRLTIAPSTVHLCGSRLDVNGSLNQRSGDITVDLDVNADRVDDELVRTIRSLNGMKAGPGERVEQTAPAAIEGVVHIHADEFAYQEWIWSTVDAAVHIDPESIRLQINAADLCGIDTIGELVFSPQGTSLHLTPRAEAASLQETAKCLQTKPVRAEARYDLSGDIRLPACEHDPLAFMTGNLSLTSTHGRIHYSNVLMKLLTVLNLSEVFAGGTSDLTEDGYGYTLAQVKTEIGGGKLHFTEILLDGNALKITGQGSIDLHNRGVDIALLAAPLKTVDRLVNKLPVISYIAGGSLISIPLRLEGTLDDIKVSTMSPSAVGKGLLNIMNRTLRAPFKLVEGDGIPGRKKAVE